jgi:murein DD-endopeptidase MepM/ murein hydrolase activator NlpD
MPVPNALNKPLHSAKPVAVRNSWHAARPGGRRHEGIDIFSGKGTPVYATTEGIVMRLGRNTLGGNVVWILGPGGQRHYYAHLDRFASISAGERIQPGTVLGYVGNTGNARTTAPHLHYGIYDRAGAINPYPLLADERTAFKSNAQDRPTRKHEQN